MGMIEFQRPDGGKSKAYLAEAGKGKPGVVVIQEWWGVNDQIMGVADRLARAGFNALAPDLYKGRVTAKGDEANHLMAGLDFADATHQELRGAVLHLAKTSGKIGVTGFCLGGSLSVAAAVHIPEASAAAPFYGVPDKSFADPAKIRMPLQGHFANEDGWCTPAKVDELEAGMKGLKTRHEVYRYDAKHAFTNERSEAYDVVSANLAWERLLGFFKETL